MTISQDVFKFTFTTPFPVGDVNAYLIKGDVLTLVDAGVKTNEAWQSLISQLKELGYVPSDIEQAVITHHHPDHVGLLDYFREDLPIIGHPKNQPWISQDEQFFTSNEQFFVDLFTQLGIEPGFVKYVTDIRKTLRYGCHRSLTTAVVEGDVISGLSEWRIIETPGHAQSHIVLYRERDGLVIGGDQLLAKISPNPLLEPPQFGETVRPKPLLQYNDSLKKLLELDISVVVTGHGDDILHAHELIHKRLGAQKERAYHVLTMIREKPMTAFETCMQLFPKIFAKEPLLTMSETIGQLDFLEELGEIKINVSDGQFIYHV
ncbi:MBL fold metallo-hydrolase [Fredinandcohnia quinoae]|uniref:MBL fold metallo-hydrolase n=1 Tax=Fredinandcohnia quinoae TaxID=2918902 RepID=A0AAW5E7V2_9BACI|nr:MBL fold metallo-hydrolase [Fredinandcohnia sp. SECRCQ15]MCH1624864.1 MBL fold metallo-hydrolase [Fredinandcohnia sp. SECRCQ15]